MCVAFALLSLIQLPAMVISDINKSRAFFPALFSSFFHFAFWKGSCVQHSQYSIPFFQPTTKNSHHIQLTVCCIATWKKIETHLVRFSSMCLSFFDQIGNTYERIDEKKHTQRQAHKNWRHFYSVCSIETNTQYFVSMFRFQPEYKECVSNGCLLFHFVFILFLFICHHSVFS